MVWLTGLSGSGKTTLGRGLTEVLRQHGRSCLFFDGDDLRQDLSRDLGFSAADRRENVRRAAALARLTSLQGVIPVVALISPYATDRAAARRSAPGRFLEIFVDAPVDICRGRDPKRLYARVASGEITAFTGVSDPYESPVRPELHLTTASLGVDECIDRIFQLVLATPP